MNLNFTSSPQETLFNGVLANLGKLGYQGELLQTEYSFLDWFQPDNPTRVVPAAAFGQTPQSYDSACVAVLLSNGRFGAPLVAESRALGAPYAFEVRDDEVVTWVVGRDEASSRELLHIRPAELDAVFETNQGKWGAADVLRSKGIAFRLGPRQLDFIDLGLIPALEHQISSKLDRILREVVQDAVKLLKRSQQNSAESLRGVYRLIFRFLAGKVLHDRDVAPFRHFDEHTARTNILDAVAKYYGEQPLVPNDSGIQDLIASNIWTQLDFRNLSVEVLAYIYENTFVDDESRRKLGTHGTPHAVARYLVHQVPFEQFAETDRQTVEPFCGHGVFLVAALQRLRELLPARMDAKERHKYFVRMLRGFEIDQFALEVSRLCLMLADFPNHNGWKLSEDDVFSSDSFSNALGQSRIVLSNPPFEDFTPVERKAYSNLSSTHKPVELLNRVLKHLPAAGLLGIVLPRRFLDGAAYKGVRQELSKRFEALQVVALPDGVFEKSDLETALVIATEPRSADRSPVSISFTQVADKDRKAFLAQYAFTRRDDAAKTIPEATQSLNVVALRELWVRLERLDRIRKFTEIHKGVEWRPSSDPERYFSTKPKEGFRKGVYSAQNLYAFERPETKYLCFKREYRRPRAPGGFDLRWDEPKVFVNAARVSRGSWAIVAFSDSSGLIGNKRFHAIWPQSPWTARSLAAILNSPIANAYVSVHDFKIDVRKQTLERIPLPMWGNEEITSLERLVSAYEHAVKTPVSAADAETKLLAIDAFVLRGYGLPPRLERQLLDFFQGAQRPVPFQFEEYFPPNFGPTIPLWMFLSEDYQKCSARYFLSKVPRITDPALIQAFEEVAD
jgi:type I restriction-modification system DNA methylase subunit